MQHHYKFTGAESGAWRVTRLVSVCGAPLAPSAFVDISPVGDSPAIKQPAWVLHGFVSNVRYGTRSEVAMLQRNQEPLGRASSCKAALIPIKKSQAWWNLAQDERRTIFEEQSHHTGIGVEYLPAVARKLYHCRDLGEPFDFITWFEYAADDEEAFDNLLRRLRATTEWMYVERETDIRLERQSIG